MRKTAVEWLALVVALTATAGGHAQSYEKSFRGDKPAKKSLLEEMLEQALKSNPDLRVAEAKLREAEAELTRTRLAVTHKVATLYAALDVAKKAVEGAEADYNRVNEAYKRGAVAAGEFAAAQK